MGLCQLELGCLKVEVGLLRLCNLGRTRVFYLRRCPLVMLYSVDDIGRQKHSKKKVLLVPPRIPYEQNWDQIVPAPLLTI